MKVKPKNWKEALQLICLEQEADFSYLVFPKLNIQELIKVQPLFH